MTGSFRLLCISVVAVPFSQVYADTHKGPPDITIAGIVEAEIVNTVDTSVVNTVDTNVVNTVDTRVVNHIDASLIEGSNFNVGVISGGTISLIRTVPFRLRAISTSVAPDTPGELCTVGISIGEDQGVPIGLSLMSNGEANTVSRLYDAPIDAVRIIRWSVGGDATFCRIMLSVSGEVDAETAAIQARSAESSTRVEIN